MRHEITVQHVQVLHIIVVDKKTILAVKTVTTPHSNPQRLLYQMLVGIKNVKNPVCVTNTHQIRQRVPLLGSSENDDFVVGRNGLQKIKEKGTDVGVHVIALILIVNLAQSAGEESITGKTRSAPGVFSMEQ